MKLFQRIEVLLSVGLLIAFFLPWVKVFFFTGSGYDIGVQLNGNVWLIPAASIAVIAVAFYNLNTKLVSLIAGALPFAALAWGYTELKKDVFEVLSVGAYLSLGLGVALLLCGLGVIGSPSSQAQEVKPDNT